MANGPFAVHRTPMAIPDVRATGLHTNIDMKAENLQAHWQFPGDLSDVARQALNLRPAEAYARLVVHGSGSPEAKQALDRLRPEQLLNRPVRSADDAKCLLSGLWLWHDWLDLSHEISQSVHTPSGSYWHAIMHRREGDFSNAKYWYARCRHHPVLRDVAARAEGTFSGQHGARDLQHLIDDDWDADGFVDVVEAVHRKPDDPLYPAAVKLQRMEWQALFDHCARNAVG